MTGAALFTTAFGAVAEEGLDIVLSEGTPVVATPWREAAEAGGSQSQLGKVSVVDLDGQAFDHAVRVQTLGGVQDVWSVEAMALNSVPVRAGDVLVASFAVRAVESSTDQAFFRFNFEKASPDWNKSISIDLGVGPAWRRFTFPFKAGMSFDVGEVKAAFQCGYPPQVIEIADVRVINLGSDVDIDQLPWTRMSYPGREADAPWRAEAEARIDRIRKQDLTVEVRDEAGEPIAGAVVEVEQTGHAFRFGSAVVPDVIAADTEDARRYRRIAAELFNELVFENAMKWNNHGIGSPETIEAALRWAEEHGMTVRGHTLVWPGWRWLPESVHRLESDPQALREAVNRRVVDTVTAYQGRVHEWDALNEAISNRDLMDILGNGVMADWFRLAYGADPSIPLYINDYGILTTGLAPSAKQDAYYQLIERLLAEGAPVSGVGMQGHFGWTLTPPSRLVEVFDRFAALGLPIKVTELDIDITDEQLQADYMRDFLTAAFSHPQVEGVLLWGFWSQRHWRPNAALFDAAFNVRPVGEAYRQLVHQRWRTRESLTTDAQGVVRLRGFKGDYAVRVSIGNRSAVVATTLGDQPARLVMTPE